MERKDYILRVRLSPEERKRAQQLAALIGSNVSEVIRRLVIDARVVVRSPLLEIEEVKDQNEGMI